MSQSSTTLPHTEEKLSTTAVALEIPSVHCELSKASFDGLQLWADDLSRLSEKAFNPPISPKGDGASQSSTILGSRYFARGTSQSSGLNTPSTFTRPRGPPSSETIVKVAVSEGIFAVLLSMSVLTFGAF